MVQTAASLPPKPTLLWGRLLLKRKSTISCPSSASGEVGLWPAEMGVYLWDFSRTGEILCPWAVHFSGNIQKTNTVRFFFFFLALFSILFCILGRGKDSKKKKKKKKFWFRKSKNVYDSFFLLDIKSCFKSGNATSASALKDWVSFHFLITKDFPFWLKCQTR